METGHRDAQAAHSYTADRCAAYGYASATYANTAANEL